MMMLMGGGGLPYADKLLTIQPDYLLHWPLWDAAGRVCTEATGKTAALDLVENGGFETAGAGGADVWDVWTESVGTGAIADEGTLVHGGSHAAKLTAGSTKNTVVRPSNVSTINTFAPATIAVIPGTACTFTFWTRGDGTNAGRYSIYDVNAAGYIRSTVTTGVAGTDYAQVTYSFTVPAGCFSVQVTLWCPNVEGGISYFDDVALNCNYPYSGIYQPSGITYGQPGVGDGRTSTLHNGTDSGILIGSKAFGAIWNGNVGSMISWGKVAAAGQWTDTSTFRYPNLHVKARQDLTVYLVMGKSSTAHTLAWRRRIGAGDTNAQFEHTYAFDPTGTLGFFCQGMSWDVVSNPKKIRCYLYVPGVLNWTKLYDDTPLVGIQDWDNATYTADDFNTVIASGSLTQQEWIGNCAHSALWNGVVLTDAEMQSAMTP